MALYKMGQRVKVESPEHFCHDGKRKAIFAEGIIVGIGAFTSKINNKSYEYKVEIAAAKQRIYANSSVLHPVKYDGNKIVGWETCLWNPKTGFEAAPAHDLDKAAVA